MFLPNKTGFHFNDINNILFSVSVLLLNKTHRSMVVAALITGIAGVSYAGVNKSYEVAIVSIKGDVKVDTKGDGSWFTPWTMMKLKEGAVLKTGKNSSVKIVFDAEGLNLVDIKENSGIVIKEGHGRAARRVDPCEV